MSEGIPDDFPQPTVAPPEQSSGGLSGGEIAAIVVVLIAVTIALLVGIIVIVIIYYKRRRKFKWLVQADTTSQDALRREGAPEDHREPAMAMTSQDESLPAQSLIVSNEEAVQRESEEAVADAEEEGDGDRADQLQSLVVEGAEDTVV